MVPFPLFAKDWSVVGTARLNPRSRPFTWIPISNLYARVYETICKELNKPIHDKHYKALAGRLGYTDVELKKFQLHRDPADALLSHWATKSDNNVNKLIKILDKMDRDDLVEILEAQGGDSWLDRNTNKDGTLNGVHEIWYFERCS